MRRSGVLMAMVAGLVACSGENTASSVGRRSADTAGAHEPHGEPMPHQECVGSGGDVQTRDVNNDGQPDIRTVMEGGRAKCRETDANFDGRVDIYRWFDAAGQVSRVEDDYDFDGRIDVVATWQGGVVARDILDTNFDGRTDTWRDYQGGHITELRRDSNGDGRVDTWERFDAEGRMTWSANDANQDGEPDAPADAGTPAAPPATASATTPSAVIAPPGTAPAATAPAATPPAATPPAAPATTPPSASQKTRRVS